MKALLLIIAGLATCWLLTDIRANGFGASVLAPLGVFVFSVALLWWLLLSGFLRGTVSRVSDGGVFGADGGDGGNC